MPLALSIFEARAHAFPNLFDQRLCALARRGLSDEADDGLGVGAAHEEPAVGVVTLTPSRKSSATSRTRP